MSVCLIPQEEVYNSSNQNDRLNVLNAESSTTLEEDLNYIRSVILEILGTDKNDTEVKWYKVPFYDLTYLYDQYNYLREQFNSYFGGGSGGGSEGGNNNQPTNGLTLTGGDYGITFIADQNEDYDGDFIWKRNNTELMRLKANGKLGIGTSTPQYELDVNGTIRANNIIGTISGNVDVANRLSTPRAIALSGVVSGSALFDGSSDVTINATLNSGYIPYDISVYIQGTIQQANASLLVFTPARPITISTTGHRVYCETAPSSTWTAKILKNGTQVGTITITGGQTLGNVNISNSISLTQVDVLKIVAPSSPDSSLKNVSIFLLGVA